MLFLAQKILIRRLDVHGFLNNPIWKPTEEKKINKEFQLESTWCSLELARDGSCGRLRARLHSVLTTVIASASKHAPDKNLSFR